MTAAPAKAPVARVSWPIPRTAATGVPTTGSDSLGFRGSEPVVGTPVAAVLGMGQETLATGAFAGAAVMFGVDQVGDVQAGGRAIVQGPGAVVNRVAVLQ